MSVTVQTIVDGMNSHVGDTSNDRITVANRLDYCTEAVIWLQEKLKNDHGLRTYDLNYIDTVHYYLVTTPLADLLDGADLRRPIGRNYRSMAHKSPRELAEEIADRIVGDDSWAIERQDDEVLLAINAKPRYQALVIDNFDGGVSNWVGDMVNSDITNVIVDFNEFFGGNASLRYDVIVGQSVNLRATITSTLISMNLSTLFDTGVFLLDAYIPTNVNPANITSYTIQWGTNSSNYYTTTVTTDIDGNSFSTGWFTLAFDWANATTVGTPDPTGAINTYFRIDMNFNGSLTNSTFFHYDSFRVAKPETLTFHYISWNVGTDSTGTVNLTEFTNTSYTDIPFFSGKYDQYVKTVAHKAAALAFADLRLKEESLVEDAEAERALARVYAIFPTSITKEVKSFKVLGINMAQRHYTRGYRSGNSNSES